MTLQCLLRVYGSTVLSSSEHPNPGFLIVHILILEDNHQHENWGEDWDHSHSAALQRWIPFLFIFVDILLALTFSLQISFSGVQKYSSMTQEADLLLHLPISRSSVFTIKKKNALQSFRLWMRLMNGNVLICCGGHWSQRRQWGTKTCMAAFSPP